MHIFDYDLRILSNHDVVALTGLSRATIYRYEKAGDFPSRRQLGVGRVGWVYKEVREWIDSRQAVNTSL